MYFNINQLGLGIFFLYFVLISGSCSKIMSCSLQRFIESSVIFKHIIIFLSIFIFTFLLNWYTIDSLVVSEGMENKNDNSFKYLNDSLLYSIFIYVIFVISTKTEALYLSIFLILCIVLVFSKVYLKAKNSNIDNLTNLGLFSSFSDIKKSFSQDEMTIDTVDVFVSRAIFILYILSIVVLLVGFVKYYIRQRKDHFRKWSNVTFIFGNNHCNMY